MADEPDSEETPNGVAGPLCGERLKAARLEQSIELDTVARELHVDRATLDALEENRFEALGAPVFAKGHLRKYAAFVKLPVDEILDDYRTLQSSTELPPVVVPKPAASHGFKPPPWLYGLLAAVFILAALLIWFVGGSEEPATPPAPVAEPTVEATDTAEPAATETPPPPPPLDTATRAADPDPVAATAPPAAAELPGAVGDDATLTLIYSDECWTEIRDGNGRRLYSGTGNVGDRRTLRGPLPFSVVLGNRSAVAIQVNGEPFAVPSGRARLARFTISGS